MWPWSTIRRLRTESSTYRARWAALNESYEHLDGKYKAALKEVVRAQDETASLRFVQTELEHAENVIADLQCKLREAGTVTRGPGGRFAKAAT